MKIPLCKTSVDLNEGLAVIKTLKSGWLTEGPKNQELEKQFAEYIGVKHAITVNSCASALFIAIKSLNITKEVIVPSFTFSATANAIVTAGAKPIFVDINSDTLNIDVNSIAKNINKNTQAIMIVHTAGQTCEMDKIVALAKKYNLYLIEDSAQTIGGTFKNQKAGSFGNLGCFSFFPTKNMTTGEGGMITTNDSGLDQKIRTLIAHGIVRKKDAQGNLTRAVEVPGYNFRMSNLLAAIGVEQLKKLDKMNKKRIQLSGYLNKTINNPLIIKPIINEHVKSVYQMYIIKVRADRDKILQKIKDAEIEATIYCNPPVHLQPYYNKNLFIANELLPNTINVAQQNIILPMYPDMEKTEADYIINVLNNL